MHRHLLALLGIFAFVLGCDERPLRNSRPEPVRPTAAATTSDAGVEDPCGILLPEQRSQVVARIGETALTLCDFTRRINSQNPYLRARFNAPEQRRALLQSWVDSELLAAEAHARHYDEEPAVRRAITMQLGRRLEVEIRNGVARPEVTDAEVRAYYEAHRGEYDTTAQVRASQIVFASLAEAQRALSDARTHEADDAYFRTLVQHLSIDPATRATDGDLAFFSEAGGPGVAPEVAAAAFTLTRAGQIADHVIESLHGGPGGTRAFHIVRMTARREAIHRSLEEESRRIRNRLFRDKLDQAQEAAVRELVQRLRNQSNVQIDESALAQVHLAELPPVAPETAPVQPPSREAPPQPPPTPGAH